MTATTSTETALPTERHGAGYMRPQDEPAAAA
jgi:hypothetical protein